MLKKALNAKFEPTVEETAAFKILETVMMSGQRTFTEQPNINNDVWVCCNTVKGQRQMVIVENYDLGKKLAIENGWVVDSGGRLSVTSSGENALAQNKAGTYKRPATGTLLDRGKKWAANNPLLVTLFTLLTIGTLVLTALNGVFDLSTKIGALFKPPSTEVKNLPDQSKSDFSLNLVYPENPALVIANPTDKVTREIKYAFALWNLSSTSMEPLPIRIQTFDWIGPHQSGGPQRVFEPTFNLKVGDHIIGSMAASCPDGVRGHTYLVSIIWGKGGWIAELEGERSGSLVCPEGKITPESLSSFVKRIEATPKTLRKQIQMPQ